MTTIAYANGIIAYDSYTVQGDVIVNSNADKLFIRNGILFFMAGSVSDFDFLIDAFITGSYNEENLHCTAMVFDGKDLYLAAIGDEGFWKLKLDRKNPRAIGSGSQFALGAMDAGATAEQAVKIACLRDTVSGGKVRVKKLFKINNL